MPASRLVRSMGVVPVVQAVVPMTPPRSLSTPLLMAGAVVFLLLSPRTAHAWAIGSQINNTGCHEPITAQALRNVRMALPTAPILTPTSDEAALIDDVLFAPPADFIPDVAGMTILLGVRDNDLKGIDPLSSLALIQVHGNPLTQEEHCIRAAADDYAAGDQSALTNCRDFIRQTATAALDGLDAAGMVDPTQRIPFQLYVALAGNVTPSLPLFYIKMGAAMHALEDSFTHTYRTADGTNVTVVLNWIDLVDGSGYVEARDGPPHRPELDHCWHGDPLVQRNYQLAIQAATELLTAALDPTLTHDAKVAQFDVVTAKYLTYQAGCTADNNWCDAAEAKVTESISGCNAGRNGGAPWGLFALVAAFVVVRRRSLPIVAGAAALLVGMFAIPARADNVPVVAAPVAPVAPGTPDGKEPARDVKTPTVAEIQSVRQDKELGNALGFTAMIGGSIDRGAAVIEFGMRYRLTESWLIGLDAGWNPWITTSPVKERNGVAMLFATVVRRFPMKFDRVNLRSSAHLGVSTLLFDVYGAPKWSTGPYLALSPLGIDYDLGNAVRLVIDPVEFALPVPLLGQLPLYYEQFRIMVGLQVGS